LLWGVWHQDAPQPAILTAGRHLHRAGPGLLPPPQAGEGSFHSWGQLGQGRDSTRWPAIRSSDASAAEARAVGWINRTGSGLVVAAAAGCHLGFRLGEARQWRSQRSVVGDRPVAAHVDSRAPPAGGPDRRVPEVLCSAPECAQDSVRLTLAFQPACHLASPSVVFNGLSVRSWQIGCRGSCSLSSSSNTPARQPVSMRLLVVVGCRAILSSSTTYQSAAMPPDPPDPGLPRGVQSCAAPLCVNSDHH